MIFYVQENLISTPDFLTILKESLNNPIADRVGFQFRNFLEIFSRQVSLASGVEGLKPVPQTIDLWLGNCK